MPKLFIGPYQTGLQLNLEPWLINQEAFVEMMNAYVWRGRVKKKQGIELVGRLHIQQAKIPDFIGATVAPGAVFAGNIPAAFLPISPGTVEITVGALVFTDNGFGTLTSTAVNANYGTIDYVTGAITLNFNPAIGVVNVFISQGLTLPQLPVMGIGTREQNEINEEQTIVFDTKYSYDFNQGNQQFRDVSFYKMPANQHPVVWSGTNAQFFWTTNYYTAPNATAGGKVFWATNNNPGLQGVALSNIANNAGNIRVTVAAGLGLIAGDVVYLDEITVDQRYNGLTANVVAYAGTNLDLDIPTLGVGVSTGYIFYLTNYITGHGDGIRFYDGFGAGLGWMNFTPPLQTYDAANIKPINYLWGALIVIPYKNRLLAFNTTEKLFNGTGTSHPNRVRWCQNGTPFYANHYTSPVTQGPRAGTSWVDDIVGKGGYIDAPTLEAITSVALYKDTLLVFFERSTWQLRYTGNEILPFVWERINEQMGCESTFSPIYFDQGVIAIGDKGIITSNSVSVERVDQYIPDLVYQIHNAGDGVIRVHGIRDFQKKIAYWLYPAVPTEDLATSTQYPNRVLTFNYDEKCYSLFDNSHTCFGTLQTADSILWSSNILWSTDTSWSSGKLQSYFPHVVAGNQRGFVHYFDNDPVVNDISLDLNVSIALPNSISNTAPAVVQINDHNLVDGQFVRILYTTAFPIIVAAEAEGTAALGSTTFNGTIINTGLFPTTLVITVGANTFTDLGNGTLAGGTGNSTINYESGVFEVNFAALAAATPVTANYTYNNINYKIFKINVLGANTFQLNNTDFTAFAGYTGSGQVQIIDNFVVKTKVINTFLQEDLETRINYINAYLTTADMDFTLNTYGDDNQTIVLDTVTVSNSDYYNQISEKTWNRAYPNVTAPFFQLEFTMNDAQMMDWYNANNLFELHAMILDVNTGARLR